MGGDVSARAADRPDKSSREIGGTVGTSGNSRSQVCARTGKKAAAF